MAISLTRALRVAAAPVRSCVSLRAVPRAGARAASSAPSGLDMMDGSIGLAPDAAELYATALAFARVEMAPHAAQWDEDKHFPVETLRKAAGLGLACMYVREDVGGSALTRTQGAPIIEALASGCVSTAAYITIHNMVAWMIDSYGSEKQRQKYLPPMCSMDIFGS
jgi:alkylation response protein AidB-like acyl-CoA dehydrogenase